MVVLATLPASDPYKLNMAKAPLPIKESGLIATYYEILGVKETATALEIKTAHRENALLLHPDKSKTPHSNEAAAAFRNIQLAWECLRDQQERLKYDDSLRRIREKDNEAVINAQIVKLSDMNCEICDIEVEDDMGLLDQNNEIDNHGNNSMEHKLYSVPCRCGDMFEILEEELQEHDTAPTANIRELLWDCRSCGLSIKVDNDI